MDVTQSKVGEMCLKAEETFFLSNLKNDNYVDVIWIVSGNKVTKNFIGFKNPEEY